MNYKKLYEYVEEKIPNTKRVYLFFDELQRIDRWEDAINSFRVDFDCDIYYRIELISIVIGILYIFIRKIRRNKNVSFII